MVSTNQSSCMTPESRNFGPQKTNATKVWILEQIVIAIQNVFVLSFLLVKWSLALNIPKVLDY